MDKLADWQTRHAENALSDEEIIAFFNYQTQSKFQTRSQDYNRLVVAMYTFVPYLETRPQLIPAFVQAMFQSSRRVFAGVTDQAGFFDFLESKAQVDDKLAAALKKYRAQFEAAFEGLAEKDL